MGADPWAGTAGHGLWQQAGVDNSGDKHAGAACYGSLTTGCLEHCRQCLDFHQSMASGHPLRMYAANVLHNPHVHSKWWNVFILGWEPCCGLVLNLSTVIHTFLSGVLFRIAGLYDLRAKASMQSL